MYAWRGMCSALAVDSGLPRLKMLRAILPCGHPMCPKSGSLPATSCCTSCRQQLHLDIELNTLHVPLVALHCVRPSRHPLQYSLVSA